MHRNTHGRNKDRKNRNSESNKSEKNKYIFNLSLRKQYLHCGKKQPMMDISGGSICSISDLKPRQIRTLIFVQGSYK